MTQIMKTIFLSTFLLLACNENSALNGGTDAAQLEGEYTTSYNDTSFVVWIEKMHESNQEQIFVILFFNRNKRTEAENILNKYKDVDAYYQAICDSNAASKLPASQRPVGIYTIWTGIGGIGSVSISKTTPSSTIDMHNEFYINLAPNDEHAFAKFYPNSPLQIKFLETGYIKKLWNYFLMGPTLTLKKQSNETHGLLKAFMESRNAAENKMDQLLQQNQVTCP